MRKAKWYKWTWANGMVTYGVHYDRTDKATMERKYGKLISKEPAW